MSERGDGAVGWLTVGLLLTVVGALVMMAEKAGVL